MLTATLGLTAQTESAVHTATAPTGAAAPNTPEEMFEAHRDWALAFGRQIVKNKSTEYRKRFFAGQFDQAALVGLWNAARRYDRQRCSVFRGYAAALIRGTILDELRSCNYFDSRSARQEPLRLFMTDDPGQDIAAGLRDETLPLPDADATATADLLSVITDGQQRTCLRLRYIEGLNVAETAAAMGLFAVRVWNIEQQALRQIRKHCS